MQTQKSLCTRTYVLSHATAVAPECAALGAARRVVGAPVAHADAPVKLLKIRRARLAVAATALL